MKPTIDRLEWDFSSLDPADAWQCWTWEIGRERQDFIAHVKKRKDWLLANPKSKACQSDICLAAGRLFVDPGWPKEPYLAKPKRRETVWTKRLCQREPLRAMPIEFLGSDAPGKSIWRADFAQIIGEPDPKQFAFFRLNWALSDNELNEQFRLFLEAKRPKKSAEKRGASGKYLDDLKSLGALRLLRAFKNYNLAAAESDNLFSEQSAWIRARKRAERVIAGFTFGDFGQTWTIAVDR